MEPLDLTIDVYKRVLDGIKKESTGILPPVVFNRLANDAQSQWLADKLREIEKNQKRIDDIRTIRVLPTPIIAANGAKTYPLPNGTTVVDAVTGAILPQYHRFLSATFKITYVDNECDLEGISPWIYKTFVMRSDQFNWCMSSPFRKPSDKKIGYDIIGNLLEIHTNSNSTAYQVRLDYVRPPRVIFYNYINTPGVEQVGPVFDYTGVTAGSINIEFPERQKEEIVDRMVQIYLEKIKDERYRTWIQEEYMKFQSK